ncbi:thiaminase II [Paenibacillus thalictri]|uniref:Aminopyrimidine aminohydrolase n=1 Tax=Paenibacillus thalictri TaxID=2527873 RepID=A0A4Q9E0V8_9BACL|nr:thiaminase II [Paenibacillus thalictri]TBL81783.1 thiaminase II [Paenibacillus thalictri]
MLFSQLLRQEADAMWQASFDHPFVRGIADGSLPLDRFRYYVLNDSYYLGEFAKVQAIGAAKSHNLHTSNRMAAHVQGTYNSELALHETFVKRLGITEEERAAFKPAPASYAYTSHLHRAAYNGHLGDIVAALLPCYWLYFEIGEQLKGTVVSEPIYQDWIDAYGAEGFGELVQEQIDRLDEIADMVTEADRERMKQQFLISSRYEWMFWQMAYTLEQWPV